MTGSAPRPPSRSHSGFAELLMDHEELERSFRRPWPVLATLRWLGVLPAVVLSWCALCMIIPIVNALTVRDHLPLYMELLKWAAAAGLSLSAGVRMAPSHPRQTALVLGGIAWMLIGAAMLGAIWGHRWWDLGCAVVMAVSVGVTAGAFVFAPARGTRRT